MLSRRELTANCWLVIGLTIFVLAALPFFLIVLGMGWAKRWMAAGLQKLIFLEKPGGKQPNERLT